MKCILKSTASLIVSTLICLWAGMAAADPPLDMPSHATALSGEEADEIRRELLPLIHADKLDDAAKVARSKLGEQWCDVAIEGRWRVDKSEVRRRFRLFGALTVLARGQGDLDLAAECVMTSTEYAIDDVRRGMALFELALIAQQMEPDEFAAFHRKHLALECLDDNSRCCRAPQTFIAAKARAWASHDNEGDDGEAEAASGDQSSASAKDAGSKNSEAKSAKKKEVLEKLVEAWLRSSFLKHPTEASARRLLERDVMKRKAMAEYLRNYLPGKASKEGPFDSDDKAVSWIRSRSVARQGGELPDDYKISSGSWKTSKDKPWSTKRVTAGRTSTKCPGADGEWQYTSSSYYVLVRSESDGDIFVVPVMYNVAQSCGGYGTTPEPMKSSWPNSSPVMLLTTAHIGYVNDYCGPRKWNDHSRIVCGGSSAADMRCLQVGTSRPSYVTAATSFGHHYALSLRDDGTIKLQMNSKNPAPLAMRDVFEEMNGETIADVYDDYDRWAERLSEKILPDDDG